MLFKLFPVPRYDGDLFAILLALPLFYVFAKHVFKRRRMKSARDPPGPRGWPIFGNTFELLPAPAVHQSLFRKWAKQYGPITLFKIGSEKHVIISDHGIAKELFVKRGNLYADRFLTHAVSWTTMNQNPALRPKDDGWRRERSFVHRSITLAATNETYCDLMNNEANITLRDLLDSPKAIHDHFQRFAYAVLTRALMGFSVSSISDPYIVEDQEFRRRFMATFRLDTFPSNVLSILRNLPSRLIPNYSTMEALRKDHLMQMMGVRQKIEANVANGTSKTCIYTNVLLDRAAYNITDEELAFTFQAMIGAGTNNPREALYTALSLLMEYPEWEKKLQKDIDEVVGRQRLPDMSDIKKLPLARAIVKEGVRTRGYHQEAGLPRRVIQDDFYGGYFFEKGTVFHMNFSAILSDSELYPDGMAFNPDRYLDPSYPTYKEPLSVYPNCQGFAAFGYGRRGCPGTDFAERTCVIMLMKILWTFNIRRPNGDAQTQKSPNPMKWTFELEVRDTGTVDIVRRALEADRAL